MISADDLDRFQLWLGDAVKSLGREKAQAMCLTTLDLHDAPDGRMVLIKSATREAFVFYTNLGSDKGQSLARSPRAALTFYWSQPRPRQVNVQGTTACISEAEALAYWKSRPRLSQLGAWASRQSKPQPNAAALILRVFYYLLRFHFRTVPRPAYWTGIRVNPRQIEFIENPLALDS